MPTAKHVLTVLAVTATLAACSEKPQNVYTTNERAEQRDQQTRLDAQRQRTIAQHEGNRIYNDGMLR